MDASAGPAWLFCPGDRPERFAKAAAAADVVILDLEDAVAPEAADRARAAVRDAQLDRDRTVVRIHRPGTTAYRGDVDAVRAGGWRTVIVGKCEEVGAVVRDLPGVGVIPQIETPRGVQRAAELAAHRGVVALTWGTEDLALALGCVSSRDDAGALRPPLAWARAAIAVAAAGAGAWAIDAPVLDIDDLDRAGALARAAFADGFRAVPCIHPRQVEVVRAAFAPSAAEHAAARRVVDAAADGAAVARVDGRMIDAPVVDLARRLTAGEGSDGRR